MLHFIVLGPDKSGKGDKKDQCAPLHLFLPGTELWLNGLIMYRIAFHTNQLGLRGTENSLFDYAFWNRAMLQNDSVVVTPRNARHHPLAVERFQRHFQVLTYDHISQLDEILVNAQCSALYCQKVGVRDQVVSKRVPTFVHCVFDLSQPHGTIYAAISEPLSFYFGGQFPAVPYIVDVPAVTDDLRSELRISPEALVFGRHGGVETFDVPFAQEAVRQFAEQHPDVYFLFLNTSPFCERPNVKFLEPVLEPIAKAKFVNTCDAMVHARLDGETFGSACAEFAIRGKPILTNGICRYAAHIQMLGDKCSVYRTKDELSHLLGSFQRAPPLATEPYSTEFSPAAVMARFERVFLAPVGLARRSMRSRRVYTRQRGVDLWLCSQDSFSRTLERGEEWEPHVRTFIQQTLTPGGCFVDAGAALGYHTIYASKATGPLGRVYSFEPQSAFFELLRTNVEQNQCGNVRMYRCALFDRSGTTHMQFMDPAAPELNLADASLTNDQAGEPVTCRALDELDIPEPVQLIKIDVQGAELGLLKGAARLIERDRPYLIVEFEEHCLKRFGLSCEELFSYVRSLKYHPIFLYYRYPSDHICVPIEKLDDFRTRFRCQLSKLTTSNNLNRNLENGVTEQLAL